MAIIKRDRRPDIGYTLISQLVTRHPSLSLEAMGLLTFLLSLPEDWVVHTNHLQNRFDRSKTKILDLLRELITAGFVTRGQRRVRGKMATVDYTVSDLPQSKLPDAVEWTAY